MRRTLASLFAAAVAFGTLGTVALVLAAPVKKEKEKEKDEDAIQGTWKIEKFDTSLYLAGWGGGTVDAEVMLTPVLRNRGEQGVGVANYNGIVNDRADALAAASTVETDPAKRQALVKGALQGYREQVNLIPLHRQVIPWAMRAGVTAVHSPANWLSVDWVKVAPK